MLPRFDDVIDSLRGANYFHKLDLRQNWQVPIAENDKHKTAFSVGTHINSMSMGLVNTSSSFQRVMEKCMGDINV